MSKLHELLAVDGNLKNQAAAAKTDLMNTFEKKAHHFSEKIVTFEPLEEGAPPVTESQLEIQTTIQKELDWISEFLTKTMDVSYQIAVGNTTAKADLVLEDGTTLLEGLPATALLELEKKIADVKSLVDAIPTLDPAKGFKPAPDRGIGIWQAAEDRRTRTKKTQKVVVLYPATDKHPAQVQMVSEDVPAGTLKTQEWSGLITPAEKSKILSRIEDVARAVKKARARANEAEVDTAKVRIGQKLLKYIFAPAA